MYKSIPDKYMQAYSMHIMANLDELQLLRVCVLLYETLNGGNWYFFHLFKMMRV